MKGRLSRTTRRRFIQTSAMAGAGFLIARRHALGQGLDRIKNLRKFVAPLPLPGSGLALATPDKELYGQTGAQADFYRIAMGQYRQSLHPDLPASKLRGYADATSGQPRWSYLGGSIVATKGTPARVNFINLLPNEHPLPVDHTIMGAETGQNVNRAVAHLHGGFVPSGPATAGRSTGRHLSSSTGPLGCAGCPTAWASRPTTPTGRTRRPPA